MKKYLPRIVCGSILSLGLVSFLAVYFSSVCNMSFIKSAIILFVLFAAGIILAFILIYLIECVKYNTFNPFKYYGSDDDDLY